MAFHGLESFRYSVVFSFIITRSYPYFALVFYSYLSRSNDMPGRVERKFHPIDGFRLPILYGLYIDIAKPMPDYRTCTLSTEVGAMPPPGVIGMPMRNQCALDGLPGVYMYLRWRAVDALIGKF
jgi:hypothetical protein